MAGTPLLFICVQLAPAQQAPKIPRIGYISPRAGLEPREKGFRDGLRELGYGEGDNIVVEWRFASGDPERLSKHVADLVGIPVDVVFAQSTPAARAVRKATEKIPIVIVTGGDPVAAGLVNSLSHPGGNVTGLTSLSTELSGKRMDLLKEILPQLFRVGVLRDPDFSLAQLNLKEAEISARSLGLTLYDRCA